MKERETSPHQCAARIGRRAARDRLQNARVLVVGVGGLGSPAAVSLAAAGVGRLGLMDGDAVDTSNLHRQLIYRADDIGRHKVIAAAERITARFPDVAVQAFDERLSADNLSGIFPNFDFVIDATDHIDSKYLINDGAVLHSRPFSHAGVLGFVGQTMTVVPAHSACLRCLFPTPPSEGDIPTCQEAGIVGALAGTVGAVQAAEALKYLLGIGALLMDRMLTYDAMTSRWRTVQVARDRRCPLCGDHPTIQHVASIVAATQDC